MRVLFLTLYPDSAASPRYRIHQFLPYLQAHGVECTVAAPLSEAEWHRFTGPERRVRAGWYHLHETARRIRQLLAARRYEVVVLQKAIMSAYVRGMPGLLVGAAGRLVYDIDDAVHLCPPHPLRGAWRALEDAGQIRKVMHAAHLVLAGNAWLAEEARKTTDRATLFPTVVDTERFKPATATHERFQIGWIGSPGTTGTLNLVRPVLESFRADGLRLVGADPKQVDWARECIAPWRYEEEVSAIQGFSVGIMPQFQDEWTRGKCALKALLCMACGVPCIATPFGAVLDIIEDGVNGLFAESPAEWRDALERLREPAYRNSLGRAARATIEAQYALSQAAPRLLGLLKGLS